MIAIQIVDYTTLDAAQSALFDKRTAPPADGYEIWSKYHDQLCKVASRYGSVSCDYNSPQVFYYSGDWFHHHGDGFALQTVDGVQKDALRDLQRVVSEHHHDASLSLDGDFDSGLDGLTIFITSGAILVAWYEQPAKICKQRLTSLGIDLT